MSAYSAQARPRLDRPPLLDLERHALFLDLDGTLLEIEERPDLVAADEALRVLLRELHARLGGALAIVSGRAIADIDRILGASPACVSGVHGQEHRINGGPMKPQSELPFQHARPLCADCPAHDGGYCDHHCQAKQDEQPKPKTPALEAATRDFERINAGDLLKVLIEHKGGAIAIHYRQASEQGPLVRRTAEEIARRHGLYVIHGHMVVELLSSRASKADAVTLFMRLPLFAGRTPLAVGDDVTDEDAFAAARGYGGVGVRVGDADVTNAAYRLASVAAVRKWLSTSLNARIA